jgi:hypothetical protein
MKGRRGRGRQRWPTMGRRESRKSVRRNMSRLEVMNRDEICPGAHLE